MFICISLSVWVVNGIINWSNAWCYNFSLSFHLYHYASRSRSAVCYASHSCHLFIDHNSHRLTLSWTDPFAHRKPPENRRNPPEDPQENHMTSTRQSLHMVLVMIHMFKEVYEECRRIYLKLQERPRKSDLNIIVLCSNYYIIVDTFVVSI